MSEIHTVKQGEYLSSIALDHGFSDWHTIYDHPNNAELKKKRASPDILLPGDEVFIPDKQEHEESCTTGQTYEFQVTLPKIWLRITLKDETGNAIANEPYKLNIAGRVLDKATDGTGLVQEEIPVGVSRVRLTLKSLGFAWDLYVGHLDPVHDLGGSEAIISGAQARLNNLGFYCGPVDGVLGPKTKDAVKRFQEAVLNRKDPDGELDQDTRDALTLQHSS